MQTKMTCTFVIIFLSSIELYYEFGPLGRNVPGHSDVTGYWILVERIYSGLWPYRDFTFEYPPLSLLIFLIPRLFSQDHDTYRQIFAIEMIAFQILTAVLIARRAMIEGGRQLVRQRLAWLAIYLTLLCPLVLTRFDIAAAALSLAMVEAYSARKLELSGILGMVGMFVKLFPFAATLPLLTMDWRTRRLSGRRFCSSLFFTLGILTALTYIWFGFDSLDFLYYHLRRDAQVESIYANYIFLYDLIMNVPTRVVPNYGAWHVTGRSSYALACLAGPLQVLALVAVAWLSFRSRDPDPLAFSTAALVAFVVLGKVFSPQYLLWMAPFIPSITGRFATTVRISFTVCCLLTLIIFPYNYGSLLAGELWIVLLLSFRNLLLICILLVLVLRELKQTSAPWSL